MAKVLDSIAVVELLRKRQGKRSLREFAKELGISAAFLSDIYHGRRKPGPAVLKHFGLERKASVVTEYSKA